MRSLLNITGQVKSAVVKNGSLLMTLGVVLITWGWGRVLPAQAAQNRAPQGVRELMQYRGEDREKVLLAEARKEGEFVLYCQINQDEAQKLMQGFEKKYGIAGKIYRAQGETLLQKLLTEARVGRIGGDAIELDSPYLTILQKDKLLTPFWSPYLVNYSPETKDPGGHWQAERLTLEVMAYNTKKLPPSKVPHTFEDLLKPEYKGTMGLDSSNAAWFATLVQYWGEEKGMAYFKKLGTQNLNIRKGHTLLTTLTVAGELAITVTAYNHKVEQFKSEGAPIEWVPLEPVVAILSGVAVPEKAKHPASGILFCDYILSREGQEILRDVKRIPAHKDVAADPPRLNRGFKYISSYSEVAEDYKKWQKLYDDLVARRRKE